MRIKLDQTIASNSDLKIISAKKKKILKKGTLKSRELRDTNFYIENGAKCKCSALDTAASAGSQQVKASYLVMGHRTNDRMMLSFVQAYNPESSEMSRAMAALRKKICKAGIQAISPSAGEEPGRNLNDDTAVVQRKGESTPHGKMTDTTVKKNGRRRLTEMNTDGKTKSAKPDGGNRKTKTGKRRNTKKPLPPRS